MKLNAKDMQLHTNTYQVSYHAPAVFSSREDSRPDSTNVYPSHIRVRAETATIAIKLATLTLEAKFNQSLLANELAGSRSEPLSPDLQEFFFGRPKNRFHPSDFAIMEVKVVA